MTLFYIGNKPGVGQVMKIMADDADNPETTPNTAYGKFRFNSETGGYCYVNNVFQYDVAWDELTFPTQPTTQYFYPGGDSTTSPVLVETTKSSGNWAFTTVMNPDWVGYASVEKKIWFMRLFMMPAGVLKGANLAERKANVEAAEAWASVLRFRRTGLDAMPVYYAPEFWIDELRNPLFRTSGAFPTYNTAHVAFRFQVFVTDMPIDDQPYLTTGTPVAGQTRLVLDKSTAQARMARPGYDAVTDASDKMIFDSGVGPMKVAGTGFVSNLVAGATYLVPATDLPISKSSLVIAHFIPTGAGLMWPPPLVDESAIEGLAYRIRTVSGENRVEIKNGGVTAVDVRYAVMTEDAEPLTSGSAEVIDTNRAAGYVRIIRPGASSSPSARDVLIDSRSTAMPLVAQGNFGVDDLVAADTDGKFGTHMYSVTFANDGTWKPYVIAMGKFIHSTSGDVQYYPMMMHWVKWKDPDAAAALTFCCAITDNKVTFYGFRDNALGQIPVTRTGPSTYTYTNYFFSGGRYYIYALPT